jgi:tetratricopeptide (TPR) repeat protein
LDVLGGKSEDGRNRLRALNAAGETDPTIRMWLGNLEDKKGNSSAAIDQFRKVVDAEPDNAQALNNLAYLLAENSAQREEALKYAQRAVELAPEDPAYGDTLGWILYQKGLYGNAVKYLERAGASRSNVVWKYHLAMAYAKAGQVAQSKTTLQAALKLNPNLPEAKIAQELVLKTR